MKLAPMIITRFGKWFAGGVPFEAMKAIMLALEDRAMTGPEKKRNAILMFQELGYSLAGWAVDTLVQIVHAWIQTQQGKLNG